jgi:hypothetical protein
MKIKGLSIFAIISFIIVSVINFTTWKIECNSCKADKIEATIENLCLSYIAGYIFYYLNIYLVERREKKHIMPFISSNVMGLISNNHTIIHNITGQMKFDFKWWLNEQEFKEHLANIQSQEKVKYYFQNENWIFFLNKRKTSTIDTVDKLLLSGKYLDEELRDILFEIRYSSFLRDDVDLFSKNNYKTWFRYFERVQRLKPYFDKNLKTYYKFDKYIG